MVGETGEGMKPLIIQGTDGGVIGLEKMNAKAHQKSRENGILWMVHGLTGRVLPFREGVSAGYLRELRDLPFAYTAVVDEAAGASKTVFSEKTIGSEMTAAGEEETLARLAGVIASRHREMPEGSYTTHLFKGGADKIRKKLGEEAVELILARDRGEVVSETADLFYHTLVLLEALNIPLGDILGELGRRARGTP